MFYKGDIVRVIGTGDGVNSTLGYTGIVIRDQQSETSAVSVVMIMQGRLNTFSYKPRNLEMESDIQRMEIATDTISRYNRNSSPTAQINTTL